MYGSKALKVVELSLAKPSTSPETQLITSRNTSCQSYPPFASTSNPEPRTKLWHIDSPRIVYDVMKIIELPFQFIPTPPNSTSWLNSGMEGFHRSALNKAPNPLRRPFLHQCGRCHRAELDSKRHARHN